MTIVFEDGAEEDYRNVGIQTKNKGNTIALFDLTTYVIVAEFDASHVRLDTRYNSEVLYLNTPFIRSA